MTSHFSSMPKSYGNYLRMGDIKDMPGRSVEFVFFTKVFEGLERWTHDTKPIRIPYGGVWPEGVTWRKDEKTGLPEDAKHFKAGGVFTLGDVQRPQIYSWTQKKFNERLLAGLEDYEDLTKALVKVKALKVNPPDYEAKVSDFGGFTKEQQGAIDALVAVWTGPVALFNGGDPFAPFGEGAVAAKDGDIPF